MEGWIKVHRRITNWEWYHDLPTFKLFMHCLFIANVEDKKWKGILIKRGQFVRSLQNLATECGLTMRQVRTAIEHLESTQSLTRSKIGKTQVFTVVEYDTYQASDTISDNEMTQKRHDMRHDDDTKTTQSKEYKNDKKKEIKNIYGAYNHVRLKSSEREELVGTYGEDMTQKCITFLDEYIEMKGYKAKSHYLCIRRWVVDAVKEREVKQSGGNGRDNSTNQTEYNPNDYF